MPLEAGHKLAHYEILDQIGQGGMGEVYRARDTKLGRDVAVKVLPDAFAEDDERMARFEREARVLASLNHPNIAAVYGLEASGGTHYLVMELVPGESLWSKLQGGALSKEEVVAIARQLIDGLEAAHESGVVHRDLKPANVQLTPDGRVKVLDFGLAKVETGEAPSIDSSLSPTMTREATQAGIILGTAAYMSPEQARGLPVDKRSDIFSFGCLLFEMMTGRKAFGGELVSDVMASVIKSEPDWSAFPPTSIGLRKLLERCLTKDPKTRLRDIGDARAELDSAESAPMGVEPGTSSISRRGAMLMAAASSVVFALLAAILVASGMSPSEARRDVTRLRVEAGVTAMRGRTGWLSVALSPDGGTLAMAFGRGGLFVRRLNTWETQRLADVGAEVFSPFFSPNGEWIGFSNYEGLHKARVEGGTPVRIADLPEGGTDGSWTDNGTILLGALGGILEVDETGGTLQRLVTLPEAEGARSPVLLPGGTAVLFQHVQATGESVAVCELSSGKVTTLVPGGLRPHYLSSGHLVYQMGSTIMAVAFDANTRTVSGSPVPVVEAVARGDDRRLRLLSNTARYAISSMGTLAYFSAGMGDRAGRTAVVLDPYRDDEARVTTTGFANTTRDIRVSPDGTRLAAHQLRDENDVWVYELETGTSTRLTQEPGEDETPVWSPDGRFIAFAGQRDQRAIFRVRADGSGAPESLWKSDRHAHVSDWSSDGKWLLLDVDAVGHFDIWVLAADGESEARPLLDSRFNERLARFSPDGRFFAYVSSETGREEVYLQGFPDLGDKRPISNEGGTEPIWSRDGRRLFYRSSTHVMSVDIRDEPSLRSSTPEAVFEDTFYTQDGGHSFYDILPDGRFVLLESEFGQEDAYVNVVVNWAEELERLVPIED